MMIMTRCTGSTSEGDLVVRDAVQWKPDSKLTFSVMLTIKKTKNKKTVSEKRISKVSVTNTISQKHCQYTHCCACIFYRSPEGQVKFSFLWWSILLVRSNLFSVLCLWLEWGVVLGEKVWKGDFFLFVLRKCLFFNCQRVLFVEFNCFEFNLI